MPIQTRQMFNPQTEAARYQLELAQALQQRAMTPNLPPVGGPVQAKYGVGQGLVDLANALASSWNVRRANQAYERAQEADKAKEEAKLRQQQEAQQASLMQMIGGQPGADGVGPPSPEPSYEQTIGMAQGAINAGVAPEIAKALIEARKPKEGYTLSPGAVRMGPGNQVVAQNPMMAGGGGTPASLQEWDAYQKMSPDQQRQYLNMKRQPAQPQIVSVNGVPTVVDKMTKQQTPLSSVESEAAAAGTRKQAEAVGTAEGEARGAQAKKAINAQQVLDMMALADPIIDAATGSLIGAGYDKLASVFGGAPDGAKAIAQLKILEAGLVLNMPRLEGPQSDRDTKLYKEAAAQLGDPTVPREIKQAAISTIRQIQQKYQAAFAGQLQPSGKAGAQPAAASGGWSVAEEVPQ